MSHSDANGMLAKLLELFVDEEKLYFSILVEHGIQKSAYLATPSKHLLQSFIFAYKNFGEYAELFLKKESILSRSLSYDEQSPAQQMRKYYNNYQHSHHKHLDHENVIGRVLCLASVANCLAIQDGSTLLEETKLLDLMKILVIHTEFGFSYLAKLALRRFLVRLKFSKMLTNPDRRSSVQPPEQMNVTSAATVSSVSCMSMKSGQRMSAVPTSSALSESSVTVTAKDVESLYHYGIECMRLLNTSGDWTGI